MHRILRKTKIVATLGPATDRPDVLDAIIKAGVNVVRINMSHGSPEEHIARVQMIRERAKALGLYVGILVDLQGPKIRITKFKEGGVELRPGDKFALDNNVHDGEGDQTQVGLTYKSLPYDVKPSDLLLLDDGRIVMRVDEVIGERVECTVTVGGYLSNNKGINLQGGGLSADAITDKDKKDILTAARMKADFLALSFPRCAEDVEYCRTLANRAGLDAKIISKLERAEVVKEPILEQVIEASDVVMIARGDLGVEIGDAQLPAVQKKIIQIARRLNRVTITATQMMESMIVNPIPTRAEVFDVANAVIDGTDAVMLSGETAVGKYPDLVVKSMVKICREAEKQHSTMSRERRYQKNFDHADEAIARSTMYMANNFNLRAIVALTESGNTAMLMSRVSADIPIYALSPHVDTMQRVTLYKGVYPLYVPKEVFMTQKSAEFKNHILDLLKSQNIVEVGDMVALTHGESSGVGGGTNTVEILTVH